jgi:hypothetical protein
VAKAANQIIVGLTIEAVAEGLVFASKAGVDPEKVRKALLGGYAQSRVLELHGRRMTERNFEPGGKVRSHKKDIEIVMSVPGTGHVFARHRSPFSFVERGLRPGRVGVGSLVPSQSPGEDVADRSKGNKCLMQALAPAKLA